MPGLIELTNLRKEFGGVRALDGVDLTVAPGELVAVVGPSGCGKSTLLRLVAGLEQGEGTIRIDGVDVAAMARGDRPVAMVFQADTLFPELTVHDNVAFGLRARRRDGRDAAEVVEVALLRLGILGLADRFPDELSGGQRRRVALARAIVLQPAVLLLDEPLSGLDAALRPQLASLIRANQRRFGLTTLYVTHDQDEALCVADRVAVMNAGRLEQVGTPRAVYNRPDSVFVASFVGRSNLVECPVASVDAGVGVAHLLGVEVRLPAHPAVRAGRGLALLRPGALSLRPEPDHPAWAGVRGALGQVADAAWYGHRLDYAVETEHGVLTVAGDPAGDPLPVGTCVRVDVDAVRGWLLSNR